MPPTIGPVTADAPQPSWWRRRGAVLVLVAAIGVVGAIAAVAAWQDRGAERASTGDVVSRFREEPSTEGGGELEPPAGVYEYDAEGTERLSLLDTTQSWGATVPASVAYDDEGCWTIRFDFSTNHHQTLRYCAEEGVLTETGGETFQRFDFVAFEAEDTTVFTCEPPSVAVRASAAPGDAWTQSCTGTSSAQGTEVHSDGTTTFVGTEEVTVDGAPVAALHYRMARSLSGDQQGDEVTEHWYAADDGMLLRVTHDVEVVSPSPVGDVAYTETGSLVLASRTPRR